MRDAGLCTVSMHALEMVCSPAVGLCWSNHWNVAQPACEAEIFGLDGDALGVDGGEVRVLHQANLMPAQDGRKEKDV